MVYCALAVNGKNKVARARSWVLNRFIVVRCIGVNSLVQLRKLHQTLLLCISEGCGFGGSDYFLSSLFLSRDMAEVEVFVREVEVG